MSEEEKPKKDQINDLIQQLLTMIPEQFFKDYVKKKESKEEAVGVSKSQASNSRNKGTGTRDGKPNKGQILTQAVEYINFLQEQVDTKNREEVELILKVKDLCQQTGSIVNDINLDNTSAEVALSRIGVGPLAGVLEEQQNHPQQQQQQQPQQQHESSIPNGMNNGLSRSYHFEYGGYGEYGDGT